MGPLWEIHEEKPQSSLNPCEMEACCWFWERATAFQHVCPCNRRVIAGHGSGSMRTVRNHVTGPSGLNNWNTSFFFKVNPGGKTLEERRSSLDAEIDSLTSILADLESSSPYKPRTQQVSGTLRKQRVGKWPASTAGVNSLTAWYLLRAGMPVPPDSIQMWLSTGRRAQPLWRGHQLKSCRTSERRASDPDC